MRTRQAFLVAGCTALTLTGCKWGSFDSLLDRAPVVVFTPPGPSTSSAFVLPLAAPAEANTTSAARMLVSRTDSDYIAVADFDMDGKAKLTESSLAERGPLGGASVMSAAVRADGMILLGVPGAGGGLTPGGSAVTLALTPLPGGGYSFAMQPSVAGATLSHVGLGVAAGNVTGLAPGNFVVVGDNSVQVVGADGKTEVASTACPSVQFGGLTPESYPFRPVAVGDLLAGGYDEIVLGGKSRVTFLQWDGTSTLVCPTNYDLTMGTSASFGSSLAVADFDGNGRMDLAVGAPPDKVYVYFGPLFDPSNPVPTPAVTITNSLPNTAFGKRIASYPVPGATAAQLLVADPAAPAGSFTGKVMLFDIIKLLTAGTPPTDAQAVVTLFDSKESSGSGLFGMSLGPLAFNPQLCVPGAPVRIVPWATNNLDVLTFFDYPGATSSDPRCFALKP